MGTTDFFTNCVLDRAGSWNCQQRCGLLCALAHRSRRYDGCRHAPDAAADSGNADELLPLLWDCPALRVLVIDRNCATDSCTNWGCATPGSPIGLVAAVRSGGPQQADAIPVLRHDGHHLGPDHGF